MRRNHGQVLQGVLAAVALLIGLGVAAGLYLTRSKPLTQEQANPGPLVETVIVKRSDVAMSVTGQGTVRAKVSAAVVPQVAGRVVKLHEQFISGGAFKAGDVLVTIDASDYELALREAESNIATAEASRDTAQALIDESQVRVVDAKDDLERTRKLVSDGAANPRELDKAQRAYDIASAILTGARARLQSALAAGSQAKVAADQARLSIERTRIAMPFDGVVVEEQVDVGQYVTQGLPIGSVYGTEAVEIPVPVEDRELAWLEGLSLAGGASGQAENGPVARVHARFAGRECDWQGRVARTEAQVDRRSRMVHLIVEVTDPMKGDAHRPPLIPGMFVNVDVAGRSLPDAAEIPARALRPDGQVWVVKEGRLRFTPVKLARRAGDRVFISEGLHDGDVVVTSALDTVTDGMVVRIAKAGDGGEAASHE